MQKTFTLTEKSNFGRAEFLKVWPLSTDCNATSECCRCTCAISSGSWHLISKIAPPVSCLCLPLCLAPPSSLTACSCLATSYGRVMRRPLPHSNRGVFVLLFLSVRKASSCLHPSKKKRKENCTEICCAAPFF